MRYCGYPIKNKSPIDRKNNINSKSIVSININQLFQSFGAHSLRFLNEVVRLTFVVAF
jgi:hypothetical protein